MVKANHRLNSKTLWAIGLGVMLSIIYGVFLPTNGLMHDNNHGIELGIVAELDWNNPIQQKIVYLETPEGVATVGAPGPRNRLIRPHLEPYSSPGGLIARVVQGYYQALPIAVLFGDTPEFIDLPEPPIGLNVRQDGGIWILNQETLVHRDATGVRVQVLPLSGRELVGSTEDAVWVLGHNQAWHITADGQISEPYPWRFNSGSIDSEGLLCNLKKRKPRDIQCIDLEGKTTSFPLSPSPNFSEKLLFFKGGRAIIDGLSGFRVHDANNIIATVSAQAAGLTTAGEAFISSWQDNEITLHINQDPPKYFPLSSEITLLGGFPIVSVAKERILAYAYDKAVWYRDGQIESILTVNDENYPCDVFPYQWSRVGDYVTALSDGTVVFSVTGPEGMALLSLRLDP